MKSESVKKQEQKPKKLSKIGEYLKTNTNYVKIIDMKAVMQ